MRIRFHIAFIILLAAVCSCDDPSLDQQPPLVVIEPSFDKIELADITVFDDDTGNQLQQIVIDYDNRDRIEQVVYNGNNNNVYTFEYSQNNRLESYSLQTLSSTLAYDLTYTDEIIAIRQSDDPNNVTELFVDAQNRIQRSNQVLNGLNLEDRRLVYGANDNVTRENFIQNNQLRRFIEREHNFLTNPFVDMNDILRFIVFENFLPNSLYNADRQTITDTIGSTTTVVQETDFVYTVQNDLVTEVQSTIVEGTMTRNERTVFNYRTVQ